MYFKENPRFLKFGNLLIWRFLNIKFSSEALAKEDKFSLCSQ